MERRTLIKSAVICTALATTLAATAKGQPASGGGRIRSGPFVEAGDGTRLFCRDWGEGAPVLFCHPWGLNGGIWEYQLTELSDQGMRCIAYDRRGHGRSDDPGRGYDFPALASDLATVIERLDLQGVTLVGYSMGSAEAIHYISRYGKDRISRLVLVSPIAPAGGEHSMIDDFIAALKKDRPAAMSAGLSLFLGKNSTVSPALAQWVLEQFLQSSPKAIIECQRAIAVEDHQPLLKSLTIPTLIIQGDKDEVSRLELTGRKLSQAIHGSELRIYEGAPHGIGLTHRDRLTRDLIGFVRS